MFDMSCYVKCPHQNEKKKKGKKRGRKVHKNKLKFANKGKARIASNSLKSKFVS